MGRKNIKVDNIELPKEKIYQMANIKTTNHYVEGRTFFGELYSNPIRVGESVFLGDLSTSPVTEIELTSKGVTIKTLNSTYLLKELNKLTDIGTISDSK